MAASNVVGITADKFTKDLVAAGAAKTLTVADNNNDIILLDTASGGSTVTLPSATGSGATFKFVINTLATSPAGHIVKVGNTTDVMQGIIGFAGVLLGTQSAFAAGATHDTITLNNGNKTGNQAIGEWVEVVDVASGVWSVSGMVGATGTPATPFSATV